MLTPAGTGCVENGFPRDHRTAGVADMGSILNIPMAVNCTMPPEFFASAEAGETVMLCSWRADTVIMELPPQDTAIRRTAVIAAKRNGGALWMDDLRIDDLRIDDLRIDTSKSIAEKGKR
jgi:hypothetical protein